MNRISPIALITILMATITPIVRMVQAPVIENLTAAPLMELTSALLITMKEPI